MLPPRKSFDKPNPYNQPNQFNQFNPTNPSNQPRYQPRPFTLNRTIIQERTYDPQIITQLLLKASTENNFIELKKFIMENGITTGDMLNDDGQSILHLILLNLNLSERQKLEMIRYFRDNGTLISSFDKLNQTPLHIACKLQLLDIAEELIKAGHDVNSIDSSYKTPLHYVIIGKSTEAPAKIDKPIIQETKKKLKSDLIPKIMKNLIEYIDTSSVRKFIENQFNTFLNSQNMFSDKIISTLESENILTKLSEIQTNPGLDTMQKQQQIFDITYETSKQISEYINSLLIRTKKQLRLGQSIENGWGPNNIVVNKVMEFNDLKDLSRNLDNEYIQNFEVLKNKKNGINVKFTELYKNIIAMHAQLNNIIGYTYFVFKLFTGLTNATDAATGNKLYETEMTGIMLTPDEIRANFTYDVNDPKFDKSYISGLLQREIYDLGDTTLDESNLQSTGVLEDLNARDNKRIQDFFVDYQTIHTAAGMPSLDTYIAIAAPFDVIHPNTVARKFNLSRETLHKGFIGLNTHLDQLIRDINNPNMCLKHISDSIIAVLGCINELPKYINEYEKTIKYFENMLNMITLKNERITIINFGLVMAGAPQYEINILYNSIINYMKKAIQELKSDKDKFQVELFNSIKFHYEMINDFINYINESKAAYYINKYYNDFADINTVIENVNTENLENMFKNPIENLTQFFKSYDDILTIVKATDAEAEQIINKTKLLNKFYLQLTKIKNYSFINSLTNAESPQNSKVGFLEGTILLSTLHISLADLNFKYGDSGIDDLSSGDASRVGLYSVKTGPVQEAKSGAVFNIVGILIDRFFTIQKYIITRYILNEIAVYLNPTALIPANNKISIIIGDIRQLKTEIETTIKNNSDDISILLITIAKLIDKIFNANIENIIKITVNNFVNKLNNIGSDSNYKTINVQTLNKIDMSVFDIYNINKSVYKLFKEHKKLDFYNYAEDISKIKTKRQNLYKFSSSNDNPNEIFMEYNNDLLELLIKSGADVNARDKDGNTPISIAIIQSNAKAVDSLLLTNISVNTSKSKNRFGYRPLDICKSSLITSIENFDNETNDRAISNHIKEVNDELMNITKINHIMRYSDITINMLRYLINHYFYSRLNNYSNYKDKAIHDMIFTSITTQIDEVPLLSNASQIYVDYHYNMNNILKEEEGDISRRDKEFNDKSIIKTNLENEKKHNISTYRRKEINDVITNLQIIDPQASNNNNELKKHIQINDKLNTDKINRLKKLKKTLLVTGNFLNTYNNISDEILNIDHNDYRTYTLLWENLLLNKNDPVQIINRIFDLIRKNTDNNSIIQNCIKALNIICMDVENYYALPNEYGDSNYALTHFIDIIIHVTKHTLIINLYNMILKLLRNEMITKNPIKSSENEVAYHKMIDEKVMDIMSTRINNLTLKEYLFDIIPEKIVKISLEIYGEDDDKNKSIIDLLNYIEKFLISNALIQINRDDSKLIRLLNQNVYPYFKNYLEINIRKFKKITDGYLSMLNSFSNNLSILDKVLWKAQSEGL